MSPSTNVKSIKKHYNAYMEVTNALELQEDEISFSRTAGGMASHKDVTDNNISVNTHAPSGDAVNIRSSVKSKSNASEYNIHSASKNKVKSQTSKKSLLSAQASKSSLFEKQSEFASEFNHVTHQETHRKEYVQSNDIYVELNSQGYYQLSASHSSDKYLTLWITISFAEHLELLSPNSDEEGYYFYYNFLGNDILTQR
jgi:Cep120 protein